MPNGDETGLAPRLNGRLYRLFLFFTLAFVAVGCFRPLMDNVDLGWHVAQGRWMVEHGAIYRHDFLNYPRWGEWGVDEYPLFQVVLYGAWSLGWWGPSLLAALAYAILLAILIRAARAFAVEVSAALAISLGLMLLFLQVATPLRPHLVTYLGIVTLGSFLLYHRNATRWTDFWPMALLQVAWVNGHSGFVIGPGMVALFGLEMITRRALTDRTLPWPLVRIWAGAFLLITLACFVNPFGLERFSPPFHQDRLESIRAYVGEMEPLPGVLGEIYQALALVAGAVILVNVLRQRGAISWSFLLLAVFFFVQALSVKKAWPIFGLFLPLMILSSGAFATCSAPLRQPLLWAGVFVNFALTAIMAMGLFDLFVGAASVKAAWREHDLGRTELCQDAGEWMKAHQIEGRIFHRCEDGGYLQMIGYDHGETYADTGFGKYPETFIREVGWSEERPAMLPLFLKAYQPRYVVCGPFCYRWPYYLEQAGWRLIFYSPNSSVWTLPDERPDLPTVSAPEVTKAFDADLKANGLPASHTILGHNLIALNSIAQAGVEDYTINPLYNLPEEIHHRPWYWEAARILSFEAPELRREDRALLLAEAQNLHDDALTAEFRAYCREADGDTAGALAILEKIPPDHPSNASAELLLKIYLEQKNPKALELARRTDCFDLRNGRHWQYLAQAEEQAGNSAAAARAWQKALFYYPDDANLVGEAKAFVDRHPDRTVTAQLEALPRTVPWRRAD